MKLTITGNTPSQKNNKEIAFNPKTGKRFVRSNDRVKEWQKSAILELKQQFRGLVVTDYPIAVSICFWFDNDRRHDLDNAAAGVMDALVKAEVLTDDNVKFVECITLQYGGIDKNNPRAEVYLDE
jgi:Holliday junction resolvase RusA-like endonuclease